MSRRGSAAVSSFFTNHASEPTATRARRRITGDVQPRVSPSETTKTSDASPVKARMAPARSNAADVPDGTAAGMTFAPSRTARIPTGTLMKKIQCQERYWVRTPPMVGPSAVPIAAKIMMVPIAFPRWSVGMYAVIMAGAIAAIIAPPTAWNIRDPIERVQAAEHLRQGAAEEGPEGEDGKAGKEDPLEPDHVGNLPEHEHAAYHHEQVGGGNPAHGGCRDLERLGDGRERDIDNSAVKA